MNKISRWGPFSYYRHSSKKERKNFLSVWMTAYDSSSFGWEWGTDNNESNPSWQIRLNYFNVFSYEKFKKGFMIYVLGFWYMS